MTKPVINSFDALIEYLDEKFIAIDNRFKAMDQKISDLPTKSWVEEKLIDLEENLENKMITADGSIISKLKKEEMKLNRFAEMLKNNKFLTESDYKELTDIKVFQA